LKGDAKNTRDGKLQNVAITIDKVSHVLRKMKTTEPPLKSVSAMDLYEKFWGDVDSFKQSLLYVLEQIEQSEKGLVQEAVEFIQTF
jgi:hypothetical protein